MAPRKKAASKSGLQKQAPTVQDGDHVVFTNDQSNSKKPESKNEPPAAPRPDARKVIGGASWTGKLPVNLLQEHCQRQKWNKPDYSLRQMPEAQGGGFRSAVTFSMTHPKTKEITKLPAFHLPKEHEDLANQPTALEARHFAAAYALFRISSMKNIHMALPPQYRDLWKGEFTQLKQEDVEAGRAWKYDADPFGAEAKRQDIFADIEKRKEDKAKLEAKSSSLGLVLPGGKGGVQSRHWERAPKVELGQKSRAEIEELIRNHSIWNPYEITVSDSQRASILQELSTLGFRQIHIQEALDYCKDRDETLAWLLIHVPEDDLPPWSFPPGYSAGVSLASGDLAKEAKLKRLAVAGFSPDACATALQHYDGDELSAAQALQDTLVSPLTDSENLKSIDDAAGVWEEEMTTLEAIMGDRFSSREHGSCSVTTEIPIGPRVKLHFRKPRTGYPMASVPIMSIEASEIPAYVRLSALRQAIAYGLENCLGDMMIYTIVEWLETNLPLITENPGPLRDLQHSSSSSEVMTNQSETPNRRALKLQRNRIANRKRTARPEDNLSLLDLWKARQNTSSQIKMNNNRQKLPAWRKRTEVVDAVQLHQCVIISGETGSGKSTQAVQFILDHLINTLQGTSANILCTQPRRISALGLSERVSNERCAVEGDEVGYIIRGDSKVSVNTKITFMTTGVLLRRLQSSTGIVQALTDVSHIFVDEVHERSLDTDFLLALLRDAIKARKDLKVVLMSATLDADVFSNYFGGAGKVGRVHIEGRTFPVQDYYLDDVVRMTKNMMPAVDGPDEGDFGSDLAIGSAIRELGMGINYNLIADLVRNIDAQLGNNMGGLLVFLPGTLEIDRCLRALENIPGICALPLHASLIPAEQRRVFPPAPHGRRKVIAATNVAETSITIEDIVAVIDTGRVKETNYDVSNNIVRLQEVWASQAACKQRRGRSGRVQAGICYKLFTRRAELSMAERPDPEIRRVPLEQLCLSVKATGADRNVSEFLQQTLTPPDSGAILNALKMLHKIGALDSDRLTALGTYMSMIPADLRCAKLLVYACVFGCLETCLTMAAILTVKSPFVAPRDKREEAKAARISFPSQHGDLVLDTAAYTEWNEFNKMNRYRDVQSWCAANFLSFSTLRDIASTRSQLIDSLKDAGLVPLEYVSQNSQGTPTLNAQNDNSLLLRALIASALYPQIAKIEFPDKKYIASMSGAKELDPEAKTIKYFNEENGRVFVHPSSVLFDAQSYSNSAAYISYFNKIATSKTFVRDLTPFNPYGLLLFGGPIELDTSGKGLIVDGWLRLRGWARIGVLVSRLRSLLDDALRKSIDSPGTSFGQQGLIGIVRRLVELNGQDQ